MISLHSTTKVLCLFLLGIVSAVNLPAADFGVTSPGSFFSINGQSPNPTLTLERGKTYTFSVSTSGSHPFRIRSAGAVGNDTSSGTITYTVPMAVSNYTYDCSTHLFFGTILTVAPAPPPTVRILRMSVGTNIVLRSTGTNNWSVFPEFTTNPTTPNWFALTVQSNFFLNGTNETYCGRPPGTNVLIRVRNQKN